MTSRSATGLLAIDIVLPRMNRCHSPSVNWLDNGPISRTATLMPCDMSFFTTQAPMPPEPPVTTATSFGQSQSPLSLFCIHLFSAHLLSTESASTVAHAAKPHLTKRIMVVWSKPRKRLFELVNAERFTACSPMHVAAKVRNRNMLIVQG